MIDYLLLRKRYFFMLLPLIVTSLAWTLSSPLINQVQAQDSTAEQEQDSPSIHLYDFEDELTDKLKRRLQKMGVKIHASEEKLSHEKELLPPKARHLIFKRAKLSQKLENRDHLAKDRFLLAAQTLPLQRFEKKYPQFSPQELRRLRELLKELNLLTDSAAD